MDQAYNKYRLKMYTSPGISLTAIEANGTRIKTKEYGELVDFESGCWAAVLGHSSPEVVKVINENAGSLFHTHQFFDTEHPEALVNELIEAAKLNCNYKGTFLSSGSEAVSLAIALAELITGRQMKLSMSISYLGASSELRMPRNPGKWLDIDVSECISCKIDSNCWECGRFRYIDFTQLAAFVFEPGNSGGLVLFPPDKLIAFLTEETKKSGGDASFSPNTLLFEALLPHRTKLLHAYINVLQKGDIPTLSKMFGLKKEADILAHKKDILT